MILADFLPQFFRVGFVNMRLVQQNVSRCNRSSAETRVLLAITGHETIPPVGGTHCYRHWAIPSNCCTHQGSEIPFTYPAASQLRTRGAPIGMRTLIMLRQSIVNYQ
ncbi:hypothetical protein AVEN_54750-1 [Araneus ventricosus]|uniref:Uncharacterized protein n=1 Tax=Araneus ventricosus TaxID=182803 RepID=A0A4Y2V6E6_ARAVE|nr:hypothetical protein AVEN_54750-1 [Araneus ventricosus]